MKKYIHITKEDREFIAKAFGITERSVYNAVRFDDKRGNTELAKRIRKLALERGGILMAVIPMIDTFHDHDMVTRQYCPNGALIELDRNDGMVYVIFKGETVKTYDNPKISEMESIQREAMALR
jgi:hypothetical protein